MKEDTSPPKIAKWFQNGFHRFLGPFLRRHFHTIALHGSIGEIVERTGDSPLIVYGNHPSWWDPLIAHFLCRKLFPNRQFYAPIDASALANYPVFKKLGFFGIELHSSQGAAEFLRMTQAILRTPSTSLWLTPEGRFADCRDFTSPLMPGLAHLCWKMPGDGIILPLALEYVFWEERLPECLLRIGNAIEHKDFAHLDKPTWHQLLTERLRENQTALATASITRNPTEFELLMSGKRGAGGFYDSLRRMRVLLTGGKFKAEHGRKFN